MGARNHVLELRWESRSPMGRNNFEVRGTHCKVWRLSAMSYTKTAEPINLPFGLWTQVGGGSTIQSFARWRQGALM